VVMADLTSCSIRANVFVADARISAYQARFVVYRNENSIFLEVEAGSVRIVRDGSAEVVTVKTHENCLLGKDGAIALNINQPDEETACFISALKSRLPANDRVYQELRFQLDKRARVDICMRKIKKEKSIPVS